MSNNARYEQFLEHFRIYQRHGDKAQAYCPAHEDKKAKGLRILAKLIAKRLLAKHACDQERGPERPRHG